MPDGSRWTYIFRSSGDLTSPEKRETVHFVWTRGKKATNHPNLYFYSLAALGQMEIQCGFSFLGSSTVRTTVEEAVGEVLALDVTLHVGLGVVGEAMTDDTGGAPLCAYDVIVEVFWRLHFKVA